MFSQMNEKESHVLVSGLVLCVPWSYLTSFDDHINRKNGIPHIDESKKCQDLSYIRVICDYILVGVNMDNNFEENGELNFFFLCEGSDTWPTRIIHLPQSWERKIRWAALALLCPIYKDKGIATSFQLQKYNYNTYFKDT